MLYAQGAGPKGNTASDGKVTEYLVDDGMGQNGLELMICHLLLQVFIHYFKTREQMVLVGSNQFIHYREGDYTAHVAPDFYLIEDEPLGVETVASWKVWEHEGKVPKLALEVVSKSWRKDYDPEEIEQRYRAMGVAELVRYDPQCRNTPRVYQQGRRQLLTHWVRSPDGLLLPRELAEPDRVRLQTMPLTLRHQAPHVLRPYGGPEQNRRLLTQAEDEERRCRRLERQNQALRQRAAIALEQADAEAERARIEAERARTEAERARTEAERATALEQQNEALRAELARLRG